MPKSNKPIFDVAHPGKSTPADNSKSVIINNRPLLKDPMMTDTTTVVDNSAADTAANDNTEKPELAETSNKSEPELKPEAESKPEAKPAPAEEPKPEEPTEEEPKTDAKTTKDEAAKQAKAEDDEATKRQASITKLADSKQYYLPINSVEKRRSKRFVLVGIVLSLVLIVAWADVALDAGLIHLGNLKAPTHFFSN